MFFNSNAEDLKLMGGELYPNQDNSIFFKDNDISLGFTTRWKDEFITMIFVGTPTHFYELQLDLYVAGMWIYDVSCTNSNTCGNVAGKDLFDRKTSLTLHDLNRPFMFDQSVTGDYVSDNISFYVSYRQKFGLATQVPFQTSQSGVFGLGLEDGNRDIPIREMLHHTVQSTITILADRSNTTRTEGTRPEGSLTIGRTDTVNCRNDLQLVRLYDTNAWMIRVSLDEYTDRTTPLVAFRPGVEFTLAPRSFTDVFFYKIGAKPVGNGTFWGLLKGSTFTPYQLVFTFSSNVIIRLDLEDYVITNAKEKNLRFYRLTASSTAAASSSTAIASSKPTVWPEIKSLTARLAALSSSEIDAPFHELERFGFTRLNAENEPTDETVTRSEKFPLNVDHMQTAIRTVINSKTLVDPLGAVWRLAFLLVELKLTKLDDGWMLELVKADLQRNHSTPEITLEAYTELCNLHPHLKVFPSSIYEILKAIRKIGQRKVYAKGLDLIEKHGGRMPRHCINGAILLAEGRALEFFDQLKNDERHFGVDELRYICGVAAAVKDPKILEPLIQLPRMLPENHRARLELFNTLAILYGKQADFKALEILWRSLKKQISPKDRPHYEHVFQRCRHFYRCNNKKIAGRFGVDHCKISQILDMSESRRCEYVVPRKKRQCKMQTKVGNRFCGEHLVHDPNNETRIPCPNDPTHTVQKTELEDHLERCNARLSNEPWISKDVNRLKRSAELMSGMSEEFQRASDEKLNSVVKLIDEAYEKIKEDIGCLSELKFYEKNMKKAGEDGNKKKNCHLIQMGSIIDHLEAYGLLSNSKDSCLVDLGSGKAQLVYWTAKQAPQCNFLLIDRMGARNKFDRRAVHEDPSLSIQRLRCSIEHLDLSKVPLIEKSTSGVTVVCKHFCGSATDAGIRCIANGIKNGTQCIGFALAPCCHHKCTFEEFAGLEFLESIGIKTSEDFSALRHVSTWATCKFRESDDTAVGKLNIQKLEWGRRAKKLIEISRARHLATLGYDVKIYQYVDYEVSPENLLIVGKKRSE
ncbi:TRNA:m(4)X modification enzyme TRM13 [Aphelenchoides besseyi]|nr:TRNA:m(4)X modification enzyme TRM13 [Aphelenchoides besseyi]